ncbi:mRNA cap guanine-N7 methyltransferase-like [Lineus longissimus]|uniref:mRNA cap guanine-N7 methyltransferase-like n=1 Tax=Lineus longissimus TaxID=88925 RepID=UPI00315DD4AE
MRNLNNWIKSVVIAEFIQEIRKRNGSAYEINALDLGSGKGGDLLKWKKGNISHLICADIAGTSVEQCETRYKEMVERNSRDRYQQTMFTSEFITADCTKDRLKDRFSDPNSAIDLTSCQFAYHYSFESYEQADRMLQNACEALKPGGYFIGTTPNAFELIKRWRAAEGNNFGNEIYQVTFDSDNKEDIPLFGAKYMFHLEGVVDCPEFLVHFPTFVKLAKKHGMNLLYKKTFAEYVAENSKKSDSRSLLGKMQALEPYPADDDSALLCKKYDGYNAAKEAHAKLYEEARERGDHDGKLRRLKVGTLSQDDWDASTLYIVFAFQKDGGQLQESTEHTTTPSRKRTRWESEQTTQDTEQTASPSRKRPHEEAEVTAQETVDQEMAEDTVAQGESVVVTERAEDTADQAYVVAEMTEDTADQADVVAKMAEDTADQADVVAEKSSEVE